VKRYDRERLDDIAESIGAIKAHAANKRVDERFRRDAILYNLLIVGEAVKALGVETKAQRPEIPWRQIAGLRDRLAHEYYRIEMSEIESIIEHDLAPLAAAIAALRRARRSAPRPT
jgi:uncharacterized protein with HEPN domain